MKATGYIVIMISCSSKKEALKIKQVLLEEKKVACVNIIPKAQSFFWWEEKIDSAFESLILAKTRVSKFKQVVSLVKKVHSYKVPEIIALPIVDGNADYLKWIDKNLGT